MRAVSVFCGAQPGKRPIYAKAAALAGRLIAQAGLTLVYGGGKVGLMGVVADAALDAGGVVVGVMPRDLVAREIAHQGLAELHVVNSMHERKWKMAELGDAFLTLPGGAGTLEELFEQWTWGQLGFHEKPCAIHNLDGYFDPLCATVERMVQEGFLAPEYAGMLIVGTDVADLLQRCRDYVPPPPKWSGPPPAMT
jgi:uncharacterized protein (TIGR00730 family)